MGTQNVFLAFLQELFQRLSVKTPMFFKVLNFISSALVAITGLPAFLVSIGVTLPPQLLILQNKALAYAGIGAFIIGMLTTKSKPVGYSQDGQVLKSTNKKLLPFTAANEQKNAAKVDLPETGITAKTPPTI